MWNLRGIQRSVHSNTDLSVAGLYSFCYQCKTQAITSREVTNSVSNQKWCSEKNEDYLFSEHV